MYTYGKNKPSLAGCFAARLEIPPERQFSGGEAMPTACARRPGSGVPSSRHSKGEAIVRYIPRGNRRLDVGETCSNSRLEACLIYESQNSRQKEFVLPVLEFLPLRAEPIEGRFVHTLWSFTVFGKSAFNFSLSAPTPLDGILSLARVRKAEALATAKTAVTSEAEDHGAAPVAARASEPDAVTAELTCSALERCVVFVLNRFLVVGRPCVRESRGSVAHQHPNIPTGLPLE
jgi:hypothetical protein